MLLVVDIGNTNAVLGIYEGDTLVHDFRLQSSRGRTADEFLVLMTSLLASAGLEPEDVTASILGSVVPALTDPMARALARAFDHDPLIVGPGIKTGMPILVENPREVGADRIVNAIAAYERVKGALIAVDFGTATTFDCVSQRGEYLGGAIAPGISLSAEALFARAARLPKTEITKPTAGIGRNTVHMMQSGLVFGYVALVDGMVARLRGEMDSPVTVLATGGEARMIADESTTIDIVDEHLTLTGLRILYHRQR